MSLIRGLQICFHLIWIGLLTGMCGAVGADNPPSNRASLRKRASFAISGVQSGRQANGAAPPRLEIRQLRKNNAQWNLYLLALNEFYYTKKQTELTSYYQVAGIHGRPFTTWDGVAFANGQSDGYCTHSSTLFPVWHRPYLALYEQILYDIVQTQAKTFNSDEYTKAAATFRVPYWDWAAPVSAGSHVLPDTISGSPNIQLSLPTGSKVINNPLFRYHFHPLNANELPDDPFNIWEYTLRYPDSQSRTAQSQNPLVVSEIDQSQGSFSQRFINLLQVYPLYHNFSNKAWIPDSSDSYDSLESLHDQIHGLVGINGGHMAYLEYSAFDPIFWLHHANVDRLFAIWQAIYPNSWIQPEPAVSETATIKEGDILDTHSPLKPFHKNSAGQYWTADSSRKVDTFGYTYPELQGGDSASVKRAVNAIYSGSAGKSIKRRSEAKSTMSNWQSLKGLVVRAFRRSSPTETDAEYTRDKHTEWIANIRVAQDALGSTFYIHIFLGDFKPDPPCWPLDPNLVGTHSVFNSYSTPTKQHDLIITGTIPLTRALRHDADAGKVNIQDEKAVEEYLTQNLHWRITKVDGTPVAREEVHDLKISVVSSVVTPAADDCEFPTWAPFNIHPEITHGRPAGFQYGDRT